MFRKTLIRLTATNSVVFVAIFMIFAANIYGYVAYRLFDQVDDAMRLKANVFQLRNGRPLLTANRSALFDPRIFLLLRGVDGRIVSLYSNLVEDPGNLQELAEQAMPGRLTTREIGLHSYRILALPYEYEDNLFNRVGMQPITVQEVITISIVDSELALLRMLLLILLVGLIGGTMIIISAGYYLARRALVPVRVAWEKQQQFVADASHELRTPLAVIKSNAELTLRHPAHTIEEESIRITNVIRETIRMSRLVSSLLTLARADAEVTGLVFDHTSLRDIIDIVVDQFRPIASMKGVSMEVTMPTDIVLVADKERLHQLLVILLDNAIKYTTSGNITISCLQQSSQMMMKISDTGCGIQGDDLPHVFDRFFRGDKARTRDNGGTGLGLSIAKWIVEAHGGKIKVTSQSGVGTEVQVSIPLQG